MQAFALNLGDEIVSLHKDLQSCEYIHGAYLNFSVNDPKPRSIHKAAVRDRLLHHAVHRKLYSYFANTFISDSFSCQTGKELHRAIDRFRLMAGQVSKNNTKTCWILKCDIRRVFASIDHAILQDILQGSVIDHRLMDVLGRVIKSFEASSGKGLLLGNLTSQLLSNVYMNEFDQVAKHTLRVKHYIRYADDFVFMSNNWSELSHYRSRIEIFLWERLALQLHSDKVSITTFAFGIDFLGWIHFPNHRIPRTKTKLHILQRTKQNPKNETLQSYLGLIKHGDAFELQSRVLNEY